MKRTIDIIVILMLAAVAAANVMYVNGVRRCVLADNCESVSAQIDTVKHARLVFAGDLMVHKPMLTAAERYAADSVKFDFRPMFRHVAERFRQADYAILNLETTLSRNRYSGYPCFRTPVQLADAMADMGIDAVVTANNHCCDGGASGISTTLEMLDSLGIAHTGTFADSVDFKRNNPYRFECGDISFALFSYTYGTNGLPVPNGRIVNLIDTVAMAGDLSAEHAGSADVRIVFVHWGNEYERRENRHQRDLAAFLHRHGADVVIGSHPHVIQPFEADSTSVTIYSLGNFVSNQQWRYSDGGLIATIDIEKRSDSRPTYKMMLEPVWVMVPDYTVIPTEVGDTIPMADPIRRRYREFLDDTHRTLSLQ